jgi:hypothetical protein
VGVTRRRELGKFVLDLGRLIFAGTVLAQLLPGGGLSAAVLVFGALATVAAVSIGLAIIPEEPA